MLEKLKKHRLVGILLAASFLLVLADFAWTMISLNRTGGPFILHFDDLRGITMIGDPNFLILMGFCGLVMIVVNGSIAFELEDRNGFFGKLIAVLTFILSSLLFIAFAAILSVN